MKSLNERLNNYLKQNPKALNNVFASSIDDLVKLFQSCVDEAVAEAGIPQSDKPLDLSVKLIEKTAINGELKLSFGFDHAGAMRDSLYPKGSKADLIYIFNNGYTINAFKTLPVGTWRGKRTKAWRSRSGKHFVQAAVDKFNAKAPVGITATYDESYY